VLRRPIGPKLCKSGPRLIEQQVSYLSKICQHFVEGAAGAAKASWQPLKIRAKRTAALPTRLWIAPLFQFCQNNSPRSTQRRLASSRERSPIWPPPTTKALELL